MRWRRWAGGRLEGGASVKVLNGPDEREMTNDAGGGGVEGRLYPRSKASRLVLWCDLE